VDNSQGYDNFSDSDAVRVYSGDLLSWFFLCVSIERDWTASLESRLSTDREQKMNDTEEGRLADCE